MVLPVGDDDSQRLIRVERLGQRFRQIAICDVRFVRLIGRDGWAERDES